jgi:Pyruvate/2-oxoacid:ferredoxin oxidoreductase delta subunit
MAVTSPYERFADMMQQKDSKLIPKILRFLINEEQAELLVSLPGTAHEMAQMLARPVEEIEADLAAMFRKGLTFKKEKAGITLWRAPSRLTQFHDATLVWPEAPEELLDLWRDYMEQEYPELARSFAQSTPRRPTRVIPVGRSIEAGRVQVLAPENLREIIENARRLAVTNCTCRLSMRKCDAPLEVCLQINRGADYAVERGSGRELSKEEARHIIRQAENAGLIHVTMNKADVAHYICNCCGCCCISFSLLMSEGLRRCEPSRYRPEVDEEVCSACGMCEDRCWFNAIVVSDDDVAMVHEEKCLGCGQCAIGCPEEAISMIETREPGFIPE